jgi:hypothetical protein
MAPSHDGSLGRNALQLLDSVIVGGRTKPAILLIFPAVRPGIAARTIGKTGGDAPTGFCRL